ncbi:MAG: amino acid decarboxylase [Candidatus Eisenbacteria bacterium]|nr:amino acid decarboxylase [Candidatus Eisenbacteria bacterium]
MEHGSRILTWISDYLRRPEALPVLSRSQPGEIRGNLPKRPPRHPQPMKRILDDFERLIVPGNTHWNHPGFMAYFGITGSMPGILAEALSAALNVNAMLWKTSPAATELEETVLDWLRQLLGLPRRFWGVMQDTASVSSLVALVAARQAIPGVRDEGLAGRTDVPPLTFYTSQEAHSSIEKAGIVLGVGRQGVRRIATDKIFRLDPQALDAAVRRDRREGRRPFAVVATAGTTSTTSVDPLQEIATVCRRHKLWLHVDAAYAGSAAILPEKRDLLRGWERADSIVVNPHKWLFTPIDCSVLYCRKPDVIREALSIVPAYLQTREADRVTNYMDYGVALGRRFRALKLWFVLRAYGSDGLRERLQRHIELARRFAAWIRRHPGFELAAPVPFSTVCFRLAPSSASGASGGPTGGGTTRAKAATSGRRGSRRDASSENMDKLNAALLDRVNARGEVFISSTRIHDRLTLRAAIGNIRTGEEEVRRLRGILEEEAQRLHSRRTGGARRRTR